MEIDWMQCELVESVEGRCGGQPTVVGTRVFPWCIIDNCEPGVTAEDLQKSFPSLTIEQVRGLLQFAEEYRRKVAA